MIGQIYKTLTYFIKDRLPEVEYISLYNNQFNQPRSNRAFDLPAILIEIEPIVFQNMLAQVQFAEVKVKLHVGTEIVNGFDSDDGGLDTSLLHLEILDKVFVGLNRVNTEIMPEELKNPLFVQGAFRRDGVQVLTGNSIVHHSIVSGSFILQDSSAVKRYTEFELSDVELDGVIVDELP